MLNEQNKKELKISFSIKEVSSLLFYLEQKPFKESAPLINMIDAAIKKAEAESKQLDIK